MKFEDLDELHYITPIANMKLICALEIFSHKKAEKISLKVEASSKEGIDPAWLRNAVEEPIEEAGVEIKKE